jgi:hypothetical protein
VRVPSNALVLEASNALVLEASNALELEASSLPSLLVPLLDCRYPSDCQHRHHFGWILRIRSSTL